MNTTTHIIINIMTLVKMLMKKTLNFKLLIMQEYQNTKFWSILLIHKFAHQLCNIDIIISPQIVCMLLTFDTLSSHVTSIMTNVRYRIIVFFAMDCFCGSLKMIRLYFWAESFEQDRVCHLITDFYHQ